MNLSLVCSCALSASSELSTVGVTQVAWLLDSTTSETLSCSVEVFEVDSSIVFPAIGSWCFTLRFAFWACKGWVEAQAAINIAMEEIRMIDQLRVKFIFIDVAIESKLDKFCSNFVV